MEHISEPKFEHVNLMIDMFIANADPEELRGTLRNLLASSPSNVCAQFTTIVRGHLKSKFFGCGPSGIPSSSSPLFHNTGDGSSEPAELFYQTLRAARSMYGVGLGFMALQYLTPVVQQTTGLRWEDGEIADSLAVLDSDMTQAIQSGKEELLRKDGIGIDEAKAVVKELRIQLSKALENTKSSEGEFPFERTQASLEYWKI